MNARERLAAAVKAWKNVNTGTPFNVYVAADLMADAAEALLAEPTGLTERDRQVVRDLRAGADSGTEWVAGVRPRTLADAAAIIDRLGAAPALVRDENGEPVAGQLYRHGVWFWGRNDPNKPAIIGPNRVENCRFGGYPHPEPALTPGTWAWAVEQMRAGRKVRRGTWWGPSHIYRGSMCIRFASSGMDEKWESSMADFDATDWEVVPPPEPAHKSCWHCGHTAELSGKRSGGYLAECSCGVSGPWKATEAEAWAAWDCRVERIEEDGR